MCRLPARPPTNERPPGPYYEHCSNEATGGRNWHAPGVPFIMVAKDTRKWIVLPVAASRDEEAKTATPG
jgi:hypothetical protein